MGEFSKWELPAQYSKKAGIIQEEREVGFNKAESEKVGQGSRQLGAMQSRDIKTPTAHDCKTCGKKHTGICLRGEGKCFKCGQEGHYVARCPRINTGSQI